MAKEDVEKEYLNFDEATDPDKVEGLRSLYTELLEGTWAAVRAKSPQIPTPTDPEHPVPQSEIDDIFQGYNSAMVKNNAFLYARLIIQAIQEGSSDIEVIPAEELAGVTSENLAQVASAYAVAQLAKQIAGVSDMFTDVHPEGSTPYIVANHDLIGNGYIIGKNGVAAYGIVDPSDPSSATSLRGLVDVAIVNERNGQVLTYDETTRRWVNKDQLPALEFVTSGTGNGVGSLTYNAATGKMTAALANFLTPGSITQGSQNGTIAVNGTDIKVKGLGTAAFADAGAFLLSSNFTKANIQSILGISDWALSSTKPSYALAELAEDDAHKFVSLQDILRWDNKWDYDEDIIKAVEVNKALLAGKVANKLTFGKKTYDGSAAQTILLSDLGGKPLQSPVSLEGDTLSTVVALGQDANGVISATFEQIQSATIEQKGIVQLSSTPGIDQSKAATPKLVRMLEEKLDHMITDHHTDDEQYIQAHHTLKSVGDLIADGQVIGYAGVAALGIADPSSTGNFDLMLYWTEDPFGKALSGKLGVELNERVKALEEGGTARALVKVERERAEGAERTLAGLISNLDEATLKTSGGTITGNLTVTGKITGSITKADQANTAGKVTNALTFGEETYDGSEAKTIYLSDLGGKPLQNEVTYTGNTAQTVTSIYQSVTGVLTVTLEDIRSASLTQSGIVTLSKADADNDTVAATPTLVRSKVKEEADRAKAEEKRIEDKLDDMFTDAHEGEQKTITTTHDFVSENTIVGKKGVAALGIVDPESDGRIDYTVLPYNKLSTASTEFTTVLTTAYAVNEVKKLVTAETSARTKDVRDLATSINGLSQTIQNFTFADLKETPTTIAGYGIEDAEVGHIDTMSYVTIEDDTIEVEPIPEDEVAAIFTL